jgi:ribonuclease VapC
VIVVDSSALMAILCREPEAQACRAAIAANDVIKISAGTMAETLIVADNRGVGRQMRELIEQLKLETILVTPDSAERVAAAYRHWGKGNHPAGLNFGDCFAYALAKELACPLVFIGNDFARTDITRA